MGSWDVSMTKMIKECDKNDNVDININIAIQIRFQEILQNPHCRRHTGPMVDTITQIIPTAKWRREAKNENTKRRWTTIHGCRRLGCVGKIALVKRTNTN